MSVSSNAIDRLGYEIGKLEERHESGLSFEELARYAGRFVEFCWDIFKIKLTPQQLDGAEALEEYRQVLIVGGNGTGKDTLTALWALFEVYVLGTLGSLSGPSDRQVREVLMRREIGRLWRRARGKLPGERYEMAIRIPGHERRGLLAFTAIDPDKWQGHHADRVFIGITEGSAVPPEIFQAAQGCLVGPGQFLVVCNPTTLSSAVYTFSRSSAWETLRWSALNHINVQTGEERIRGAVTKQWVEDRREEYGEGSWFWNVRVLAQWPEQDEESLYRRDKIEAASSPERLQALYSQTPGRPALLAVDVARFGPDSTVAAVRRGPVIERFIQWRNTDLMETVRRIEREAAKLNIYPSRPSYGCDAFGTIVIDIVGIGSGVLDRLRQLGYRVRGHNGGEFSVDRHCFNRRASSFWHLRRLFEEGSIFVPDEPRLHEELLATRWSPTPDGRVQIEKKAAIKKRLGRSPDFADALAMAFGMDVGPTWSLGEVLYVV